MVGFFKRIAIAVSTVVLTACGGGASWNDPIAAATRVESTTRVAQSGDGVTAVKLRLSEVSPKPQVIKLDAVSAARNLAEVAVIPQAGRPTKIGFSRELVLTASTDKTAAVWHWTSTPKGGHIAAISVVSTGATGVRLGLLVKRMPWDAVVRVYAQNAPSAVEISGSEIMASIHRNMDADGLSDAARTYWTPGVEGDESTVEIELPPGFSPDALELAIPRLSNIVISPLKDLNAETAKIGQAAYCEIDINCASGNSALGNGTAKMSYVASDGTSYVCSGSLLNDRVQSGTPYFLSANHCISLQSEASSLITYWFYRSTSCNSGTLSSSSKTLLGGATLLYASSVTDTSFMRLNNTPPAGAVYQGWDASVPTLSTSLVSVHHPKGDLQKISFGSLRAFKDCNLSDSLSESFYCTSSTAAKGNFIDMLLNQGMNEAGSSGSGIYKSVSGSNYLIGQLTGGSASCANPTGSSTYGRFDIAYTAALNKWLDASVRSAVYRFYNKTTGAHFFTISVAERDFVISNNLNFNYEGPAFYAYATVVNGLSSVYRFYNTLTSAHFYTISAAERDYVKATNPVFSYEGPVWYAQTTAGATTTPVYRFYNQSRGTHFYTISASERDYVKLNYPEFSYEGESYHAWSSQN